MHKKRKLISLIAISILLLIAFQFYWLEKAYDKAYSDLKRIANIEFRNVIFQLRDSILVSTLQGEEDSVWQFKKPKEIQSFDFSTIKKDSVKISSNRISNIQVFVSPENNSDSVYKALKPLTKNFRSRLNAKSNIIIKITPDSLPADSIKVYYAKALLKSGLITDIDITSKVPEHESFRFGAPPFQEMFNPLKDETGWFPQSIETEFVRLNPFRMYAAHLPAVGNLLIKQISGQIFLSITLTILIGFVLIILYKNLVAQQRLVEQKDDLISNITHELKTPISTVSVALEAIQNFKQLNPEKQSEYISMARKELTRLTSLTEKILMASFAEKENQSISKKPFLLQEMVKECWESYTLIFENQQAETKINLPEKEIYVYGHKEFLTQALSNLIENALKYKKDKAIISLSVIAEKTSAKIIVEDLGIGIASDYQNKIFEKFYRVPAGDVHNHKGYGLGLSFVKSVIDKHQGKIEVKSEVDKGSQFIITIPAID